LYAVPATARLPNFFFNTTSGYEKGDALSTLAFKMYTYRLLKYVGSYMAVLGGKVDAIIFTAGVGENSDCMWDASRVLTSTLFDIAVQFLTCILLCTTVLRSEVCHKLEPLGVSIDSAKNAARGTTDITAANSRTKVFVIPTDEEAQIAYDCLDCVGQ
jgi:acetate kinase